MNDRKKCTEEELTIKTEPHCRTSSNFKILHKRKTEQNKKAETKEKFNFYVDGIIECKSDKDSFQINAYQ